MKAIISLLLFAAAYADTSADPCGATYCNSHGKIVKLGDKLICQCDSTHSGPFCDQEMTNEVQCGIENCNSRGILVVSGDGFVCQCKDPYTGLQCDQLKCQNGGEYKNGACVCTGNFYGQLCEKSCPANFELLRNANSAPVGCYNIYKTPKTWDDANKSCPTIDKNAYLVVVNSEAENTAIKARLTKFADSGMGACGDDQIWTSGQRDPPTGSCKSGQKVYNFFWKPFGIPPTPTKFSDWGSGEPNCGSGTESCLTFMKGYKWGWNDNSCTVKFCSVCEVDL